MNSLKYNSSLFQTAQYLIDTLITTGPATLAWELTPFSFVSDWFFESSAVFDKLDQSLTGDYKKITDIWMTDLWELQLVPKKIKAQACIFPIDSEDMCSYTVRRYHRKPITNDLSITSSGRFGKKQAALSASLLHQIVASLRR